MAFDCLVGGDPKEKIWTHAVQIIVPCYVSNFAGVDGPGETGIGWIS